MEEWCCPLGHLEGKDPPYLCLGWVVVAVALVVGEAVRVVPPRVVLSV